MRQTNPAPSKKETDDDPQSYLNRLVDKLQAQGMTPDDAVTYLRSIAEAPERIITLDIYLEQLLRRLQATGTTKANICRVLSIAPNSLNNLFKPEWSASFSTLRKLDMFVEAATNPDGLAARHLRKHLLPRRVAKPPKRR